MPEPQSPAVSLRHAAEKLRTLANAAIADGWAEPGVATEAWAPRRKHQRQLIVGCGKEQYDPADPEAWTPKRYIADAEEESFAAFLAAMHPGVALLIAKSWEAIAMVGSPSTGQRDALAAARLFLGESSDG